jgi:WD40 repeat protein
VGCNDRRESGRPIYWTHRFSQSVAFSPDGQHIVSGSYDQTICVWNPLYRRDSELAHLLDTQAMSGLWHSHQMASTLSQAQVIKQIFVWNATTGKRVAGPFTGHTDSGLSVAFSPDGQQIVSGSKDKTICVWKTITGEIAAGPYNQDIGGVYSVAFSPDGQHIVSGSGNGTVCVWSLIREETVVMIGPFSEHSSTGHKSAVNSVAFSPDGQSIVSGSYDKTICVWNAMTGEKVAGPFTGHTDESTLWHSHQMVSTLSQAHLIKQFVCGMP